MKLLKTALVIMIVVAFAALVGCHGGHVALGNGGGNGGDGGNGDTGNGGDFDVPAYAGDWDGAWNNNTFGSTGGASATVAVNEADQTAQVMVDFDGNVFGGADPDPFVLNGTYDADSLTVDGATTNLGTIDLDIDADGNLTGSVTGIAAANIDSVDFSGTISPTAISLNYTVHFSDSSTARGTLQLNKVS